MHNLITCNAEGCDNPAEVWAQELAEVGGAGSLDFWDYRCDDCLDKEAEEEGE